MKKPLPAQAFISLALNKLGTHPVLIRPSAFRGKSIFTAS